MTGATPRYVLMFALGAASWLCNGQIGPASQGGWLATASDGFGFFRLVFNADPSIITAGNNLHRAGRLVLRLPSPLGERGWGRG